MSDYSKLEKCLDYQFKDKNLIIEALTHKSFKKPYNNERLEFLGDAVLNLIVGEFLFLKFPKSNEGELSKIRASLVNETGFTRLANDIKLGNYIFTSSFQTDSITDFNGVEISKEIRIHKQGRKFKIINTKKDFVIIQYWKWNNKNVDSLKTIKSEKVILNETHFICVFNRYNLIKIV